MNTHLDAAVSKAFGMI